MNVESPYYVAQGMTVHHGNCRDVLNALPEQSVHAVVTDPPYGLAFMGKDWDHGVPGAPYWEDVLRVTKPGGHLLAFGGTRTYHRLACAIEDAGWEIRDCLMWVYGSGFPKSLDVSKALDKQAREKRNIIGTRISAFGDAEHSETKDGRNLWVKPATKTVFLTGEPVTEAAKQWTGWGTALKPAYEPIILARRPLDGTVAQNVLAHGVGALNIDACRIAYQSESDKASATPQGICTAKPGALAGRSQHNGERQCFDRPEAAGRWPANLLHDGSEEVLIYFPESKGQQGDVRGTEPSRTGGEGTNCYGEYGRIATPKRGDTGTAARFFYCAKASRRERGEGNTHPTVKPLALMTYLLKLVVPPGGVVLDPFMGSGSTLVAAKSLGYAGIGCDLNEAYCAIAVKRLEQGAE